MKPSNRFLGLWSTGVAVLGVTLLTAGCGATADVAEDSAEAATQAEVDRSPNWNQLPEPPIPGRVSPIAAAVDDHLVVLGGWEFLCPPTADCAGPEDPALSDGAMYDFADSEWVSIPDAPVGVGLASTAAIGQQLFLLNWCSSFTACPDDPVTFLGFDVGSNQWTELAAPEAGAYELATFNGGVVAFSPDSGTVPVQWFDPATGSWTLLPENPFPKSFDVQVVDSGDRLLMFASATVDGVNTKLAAGFDPATDVWSELPDSGTMGYQVWPADGLLYLNPHFGPDSAGGVFDAETNQWTAFPPGPDSSTWNNDMAGLISETHAVYEYDAGWVFDATTSEWIEIPHRFETDETTFDETAATVGNKLIVAGGQRWAGELAGELLNEVWVWTPPNG